ncbi:MAG TPA: ABC transporter permease [Syntrophobacteraceae bacterium]|nr:ABC transporter permease [Syntrophobacteraceae bacterium]
MKAARVVAVASRECREVVRDRLFFVMSFLIPPVLLLAFGYGLSLDVRDNPFAVLDYDRTPLSRDYLHQFMDSPYFKFKGYVEDERDVADLLTAGGIRAVIVIPEHFQQRLLEGRPASVQTLIDGTFPVRAQTTIGYVDGINRKFSMRVMSEYLARTAGIIVARAQSILDPIQVEVRYLYNASLKSDWSLTPRLMMMVLMICPPLLTSMGVVREKETGAIYNIYSSTITKGEYLLGKLFPYVMVSTFNVLVLWVMAVQLFGAPFRGDPLFFFAASTLYIICTTGIGLIVSVLVRTQVAATLITFICTVVPSVFYSGVFVPILALSKSARFVAHLLPAMYYTDIVTGCFLKGIGLRLLWVDAAVLIAYVAALYAVGYLVFRKRPKS